MQTTNRIFDDLAKVANGAVSTVVGMKAEVETLVRQQLERLLLDADLVPRDEFDAVKEMAAKARAENEKLEARIKALEAAALSTQKGPAKKAPTKKAPKAKK